MNVAIECPDMNSRLRVRPLYGCKFRCLESLDQGSETDNACSSGSQLPHDVRSRSRGTKSHPSPGCSVGTTVGDSTLDDRHRYTGRRLFTGSTRSLAVTTKAGAESRSEVPRSGLSCPQSGKTVNMQSETSGRIRKDETHIRLRCCGGGKAGRFFQGKTAKSRRSVASSGSGAGAWKKWGTGAFSARRRSTHIYLL